MRKNFIFVLVFLLLLSTFAFSYGKKNKSGFSVFGEVGYMTYTGAEDTFDAVFDGNNSIRFGAGLEMEISNLFFITAEATYTALNGERVWVSSGGTVIRTGLSHDMTIIPITATFGIYVLSSSNLKPYVGIGGGIYLLSIDDEIYEIESQSGFGFHAAAGLKYFLNQNQDMYLQLEGRWESATGLIGESGASKVFEEDDIGGISATLKVGFAF